MDLTFIYPVDLISSYLPGNAYIGIQFQEEVYFASILSINGTSDGNLVLRRRTEPSDPS